MSVVTFGLIDSGLQFVANLENRLSRNGLCFVDVRELIEIRLIFQHFSVTSAGRTGSELMIQ